ncbi:MAG: bacillithiol system redox-active protein YtxJ [Vicinamibacterales bacterium]
MSAAPRSAALRPLTTVEELETALAASWRQPVLLFKHSVTCGKSAFAKEEIDAWLDAQPHVSADLYIVDVLRSQAIVRAITERLGIRHESPQVLLIRDGVVIWHAAHYSISESALARALAPGSAGV